MKKLIATTVTAFSLLAGLFVGANSVQAMAAWNAHPNDYATVRVSNVTRQPNCTTCWSSSVSADPGDVIAVSIYYHNTGSTPSANTLIRVSPQSSGGQVSGMAFSGSVSSSNAQTASGSASVNLTQSQTIQFVPGSARWFPNQSTNNPQAIPGSEQSLFGSGLDIGSIAPGWQSQGSVVLHFQVGSTVINPTPQNYPPTATTHPATNVIPTSAVLNGAYNSNGSWTTAWFEYGTNPSALNNTVNAQGQGSIAASISAPLYGLAPNTTYYFRAVARNSYGTDRGAVLSFRTSGTVLPPQDTCPGVVTVSAINRTQSSATLNGLIITTGSAPTTVWFEYGTNTNYGLSTPQRNLGTVGSTNFSETITGLSANTRYYFRAVTQTPCGVVRDTTVSTFSTVASNVVVVRPVVTTPTVRTVVGNSVPSLFALRVENRMGNVCIDSDVEYAIYWKNISTKTLADAVLQVKLPAEMRLVRSSTGSFSESDNTVTVPVGPVAPNQEGIIYVTVRITSAAYEGQLLVVTSSMVYTNPDTGAQEESIAYALTTVTRNCPNLLGANVLFAGFLPNTLIEWLILILLILALVFLGRRLFKKKPIVA